jgi:hypothetical protein
MRILLPLAFAAIALAQSPDYFPLQVGNQWIFQSTGVGASNRIIEVTDQTVYEPNGRTYFVLNGFTNGSASVRRTPDNLLVQLDPASGEERVLERFGAAEGATFETALGACETTATLSSLEGTYAGPIGQLSGLLVMDYTGPCADAGVRTDLFLRDVGLLRRTETSFTGPRVYELIYARIGGVLQVTAPQVSFSLALDRSSYRAGDPLTARLTLRTVGNAPLVLEFSSGQEYDVAFLDDAGKEVYRWSAGRMFPQVLHSITVNGEKNWVVNIQTPSALAPGNYTAQAWLTNTSNTPKQYSASVPFAVLK